VSLLKRGIISSYWFEDEKKSLTVSKVRYIVVLNKFWMNLDT